MVNILNCLIFLPIYLKYNIISMSGKNADVIETHSYWQIENVHDTLTLRGALC